jgi:hypothetical protein
MNPGLITQDEAGPESHLGLQLLGGAGALALGAYLGRKSVGGAAKALRPAASALGDAAPLRPSPMRVIGEAVAPTLKSRTAAGDDLATLAVNKGPRFPGAPLSPTATPTMVESEDLKQFINVLNPELRSAMKNSELGQKGVPEHMVWQLAEASRGSQALGDFLSQHGAKMASAFFDELEKGAGLGDTLKRLALTEIPGTKPWLIEPAQKAMAHTARKSTGVGRVLTTSARRASQAVGGGVYDLSSMASKMGL